MKKHLFFIVFSVLTAQLLSQEWTWVKGPSAINTFGFYGTMGVSSPTVIPGTRHGAATWLDPSGKLWLFGGEGLAAGGTSGWLNDLWKYDPLTNEWTWIAGSNVKNMPGNYGTKGLSAPTNYPGAREFSKSWTDASGNFWLFAGDGYDASTSFGNLNDLWKYDPTINEWTWISGSNACNQNGSYGTMGVASPTNAPGGRWSPVSWIDGTGNFWIFGGYGFPASGANGELNDLWKFNPVTNEWTWMKGPNLVNQSSIYGTKGVAGPVNKPGGRDFACGWADASGNLWLFGGNAFSNLYLNDLWKYNIASNQWTWMSGSNSPNMNGTYGSQGIANASNIPGGRFSTQAWKDLYGNFYLFGGFGYPASGTFGRMNDVWKYNPVTNLWTWIKGSSIGNQYGTYGTQGITAPANTPGGRDYSNSWIKNDTLWVFGGFSFPVSGAPGNTNDLWKFTPSCSPESMTLLTELSICDGDSTELSVVSNGTGTISWYSSPTSTSAIAAGTMINTPTLSVGNYTYYAEVSSCTVSPRTTIEITVNALPSISISSSSSIICIGQTATLSASGATTYSWNPSASNPSIAVSPTITTSYTVTGTDVNGCKGSDSLTLLVDPCTFVKENSQQMNLVLYPNPNSGNFNIDGLKEKSILVIYNSLGQEVFKEEIEKNNKQVETFLPVGIYYIRIQDQSNSTVQGLILKIDR